MTGTISLVDTVTRVVVGEVELATQFSDLKPVPGKSQLLATDEYKHELLFLEVDGRNVEVKQRLSISPYPVSVAITADGARCVVASLWPRQLTFVNLPTCEDGKARIVKVLDMPFAPKITVVGQGQQPAHRR